MQNKNLRCVRSGEDSLDFTFTRKNVKHINLRIKPDGSVWVSANPTVPENVVDDFVLSKKKYILKTQEDFRSSSLWLSGPKNYVSGESFMILGRQVRLEIITGAPEEVFSDGIYLRSVLKDPTNKTHKKHLISQYLLELALKTYQEILDSVYPRVAKYGVEKPKVRVKPMEKRWGSCSIKMCSITLNIRLFETSKSCIDYVVLHELCHLKHPNHSKEFYSFMTMLMPDWKQRKNLLEKQGTYFY